MQNMFYVLEGGKRRSVFIARVIQEAKSSPEEEQALEVAQTTISAKLHGTTSRF